MSILKTRIDSYHLYIYYDKDTKQQAAEVRQAFIDAIKQNHDLEDTLSVGNMHDVPVGPHTKPMFQVSVKQVAFKLAIDYLMLHNKGLSILVHPETGNDANDHVVSAMWIGEKLSLDLTKI